MRKIGGKDFVNFPSLNYQRYFGEEWLPTVSKGIHDRMRSWGLNTLGCWSDEKLQREKKTPYVLISSIWWQASGHRKFPSPFRDNFQSDLEKILKNFHGQKMILSVWVSLLVTNWNGQTVLGLPSKAFPLNTPLKNGQ